MPESAEIIAFVELGLRASHRHGRHAWRSQQVCSHVALREDFPAPAKVIGTGRLWSKGRGEPARRQASSVESFDERGYANWMIPGSGAGQP